jgi:hypothetical protein
MGRFVYGNGNVKIEIEDRTLAHLQQVVGSKLRRSESFFFSWREDTSVGGGRHSVWVHPGAHLEFKFHGGREPHLSREWLHALATVASSPTGLYVVPEPAPQGPSSEPATELFGERIGVGA